MTNFTGFSDFFLKNPILLLALLAHVLADFQFQSQRMADLKSRRLNFLILHLGIVALPLLFLAIILPQAVLFFVLVWLSHAALDFLKFRTNGWVESQGWHRAAFVVDQVLHLAAILGLYVLLGAGKAVLPAWLAPSYPIQQAVFFLALTGKPVNIIFKLFFSKYQTEENDQETIAGAGAMIGILERLIMGLSLVFGQFTSIGLIFTAKSIARYNKISESQAFAEYYLIGSLFSMISVLLAYGLLYW